MWVFLEDGTFYSVVVHRDQPDWVIVRARDERSIIRFNAYAHEMLAATHNGYWTDPEADYRYRTTVPRHAWGQFLSEYAEGMMATNFKSEVTRRLGAKAPMVDALHRIWGVMRSVQPQSRAR